MVASAAYSLYGRAVWRGLNLGRYHKNNLLLPLLRFFFFGKIQLHERAKLLPCYFAVRCKVDFHKQRLDFLVILCSDKIIKYKISLCLCKYWCDNPTFPGIFIELLTTSLNSSKSRSPEPSKSARLNAICKSLSMAKSNFSSSFFISKINHLLVVIINNNVCN